MKTLDADRDPRLVASSQELRRGTDEFILEIRQMFRHQTRVLIIGMFVMAAACAGLFAAALPLLRP